MNRREFLKASAFGAGATLATPELLRAQTPTAKPKVQRSAAEVRATMKKEPLVGIQLGMAPLLADLSRVYDDLQSRAGVNALFPFIYGNTARWAGMPPKNYRGGNYATPHLQYYKGTNLTLADLRAPEAGRVDVLERMITAGQSRRVKTFAW